MGIRLILLGIAAAALAFFVWDYTNTKAENERLETQIETANNTIAQQDLKLAEELEISKRKDDIIRRIRNAPADQDGPLAPILRHTIIELQSPSGE